MAFRFAQAIWFRLSKNGCQRVVVKARDAARVVADVLDVLPLEKITAGVARTCRKYRNRMRNRTDLA